MALLTNKVTSLKNRSTKAIGVFQKTVSDLVSTNTEIDKAVGVREGKIQTLEEEKQELLTVQNQNFRFIEKLNDFLGIQ